MNNSKLLMILPGIFFFSIVSNLILMVMAYVITLWLRDFISVIINLFLLIWLLIWILSIGLYTWRASLRFKSSADRVSLKMVIWLVGVGLSSLMVWLLVTSAIVERAPSVSATVKQMLQNARSQGELYYSNQLGGDFSYEGVCLSEKILTLIKSVEEFGAIVSCYDTDQNWALQSTLVNKEGYYCVDSDGRYDTFPDDSISEKDTACGDSTNTEKDHDIDISSMYEVQGEEKKQVLQMVGLRMLQMNGGDISLDLIEPSYNSSTNSYEFNAIGLSISGGMVHLVDQKYEVVLFKEDGKVFVR